MREFAGQKGRRTRAIAAAVLAIAMLAAPPVGAEDGGKLQLGGFMSRAESSSRSVEKLGESQNEAGSGLAHTTRFAPPSVGLPLGSGWIDESTRSDGEAAARVTFGASPHLGDASGTAEQEGVSYFTPRFSGLQLGATYAPSRPTGAATAGAVPLLDQESVPGNDLVLGVNYLDSFWGVDVALTGGYHSSSLPGAGDLNIDIVSSDQDTSPQRYSVGTSIGFSGLRLGGSVVREVGDGSLGIQSWDAGVSYVSGPWTIGVDYLQSDLAGSGGTGTDGETRQAVQAGLTYAVGPGIVASFNVMHSSGENREGNANSGTLGILGFSYNF